jgi:uncharacterized repeat protein (TIGR01451 family)
MDYLYNPRPFARSGPDPRRRFRLWGTVAVAALLISAQASPAFANIDNTATAKGTPPTGPDVTATDTESVPVAPADPQLVVTKTFVSVNDVVDPGVIAAGDTISYSISIQNTGTITIFNVAPSDPGPLFNAVAGTGSFGSYSPATATLAPGASQVYTVTYTMTNSDAFRAAGITNGVTNTAGATGNVGSSGGAAITSGDVTSGSSQGTIPATPRISVSKNFTLTKGSGNTHADAEEGDTINYTYQVVNTGNTTLTGVQISDDHENGQSGAVVVTPPTITGETLGPDGPVGTSSDAATNGVYDTLVAGGTVTFSYAHLVGQPEFNDQ